MAKSFNNLRTGKKFRLFNYGEVSEFEVLEIMADGNCKLKDISTMENYFLFDLVHYGKGEDFSIEEI